MIHDSDDPMAAARGLFVRVIIGVAVWAVFCLIAVAMNAFYSW